MNEFQPTITFADDSQINGTTGLNVVADDLWVWLEGLSMKEAFDLFYDNAEKTQTMRSQMSELDTETYEGYTRLVLIRQDGDTISVRLRKG